MTEEQAELYRKCTGRKELPSAAFNESWLVCGRRAGKSFILALLAVYLATFKDYRKHLAPGERGTVLIIAADRKQARVVFRYIRALLRDIPMLAKLIERETADAFDLSNRITIEVGTCSYRTTRGYAFVAVLADEIAFWRDEDSATPDEEVLSAVRPGMSSIPGSMLLCASSPYARRGAMWNAFQRWYGRDDASALVWRAPTREMNPTLPQRVVDEAMERDPADASAEYLAEFRSDVETFLTVEAIGQCIALGVIERSYEPRHRYVGFVDPSGGSGDSFALCISHKEGETSVVDVVRERKSPCEPPAVVEEFAHILKQYHVNTVEGDYYAGEWPTSIFRQHTITYEPSKLTKSEIYRDALPLLNGRKTMLLDNKTLQRQLVSLERKTSRGGRDSIDHPPGAKDDLANAVCGALVRAHREVHLAAFDRPIIYPKSWAKAVA
jgi:hypothetical protein